MPRDEQHASLGYLDLFQHQTHVYTTNFRPIPIDEGSAPITIFY